MNPIGYWHKKYIALKARKELTWEDIMAIDAYLHYVREEKCTTELSGYYKEVLKRFNESKGE